MDDFLLSYDVIRPGKDRQKSEYCVHFGRIQVAYWRKAVNETGLQEFNWTAEHFKFLNEGMQLPCKVFVPSLMWFWLKAAAKAFLCLFVNQNSALEPLVFDFLTP